MKYIAENDVYSLVRGYGTERVSKEQIDELPRAEVVSKEELVKSEKEKDDLCTTCMGYQKQVADLARQLEQMTTEASRYANELLGTQMTCETLRVKLKQAEAEWEEYQVPHIIVCSECDWGTDPKDRNQFKYCPNCGAKMVGRKLSDVQISQKEN